MDFEDTMLPVGACVRTMPDEGYRELASDQMTFWLATNIFCWGEEEAVRLQFAVQALSAPQTRFD
jgi:hypothetical protein